MISKNRIKFILSLHKKKYRQKYGQFTVEGEKSVNELLSSKIAVSEIFCTVEWFEKNQSLVSIHPTITTTDQIQKISFFNTASPVVAVALIPTKEKIPKQTSEWMLALDGISDPGNLGTIIRIADWYGINTIVCSEDTVDAYNPKCVSATMGSFARCDVIALDLAKWMKESAVPKYYGLMVGQKVHEIKTEVPGVIVIGSEAHGIRPHLMDAEHTAVTIKRIGQAESLNAAVATGILCDRLILK